MVYLMDKKWNFAIILISAFCLLVGFNKVSAQEYQPVKSWLVDKDASFQTDYLGNLYILEDYRLTKYNYEGERLFVYEDFSLGMITSIDVSDPLKILVFYEDFLGIVALDKTLSLIANYSLIDMGFYSVSAVGHSRDDNFWIYDNTSFRLKKLDKNGEVFYETERFNQLFEELGEVLQILEQENKLYVNTASGNILVFDRMGTYQQSIPLPAFSYIQIIQGKIIYYYKNQLHSYDSPLLETQTMDLPPIENIEKCQIQKQRAYLKAGEIIYIFSY